MAVGISFGGGLMARRRVALLIETSNAYARGLLEGVIGYLRASGDWSVFLPEQQRGGAPPTWLSSWNGDGILARIETAEIADAVVRTGLPVVDLSAARWVPGIPWVETDDREIAALGVAHFVDRGFRDLAFCGDPGFQWSAWRQDHFHRAATAAGCRCDIYESIPRNSADYSWEADRDRMARWVGSLPKPVGIMACYDIKAQQLLDVCRGLKVSVPEQVAVLGVDNDRLVCELSDPPLSSVIPNTARAGYEAAELLDRMMAREIVSTEPLLLQPLAVQARQSTDVLAIDDPEVAAVLRLIRHRATENLRVGDLLRHVPLSRRVLEARFEKLLGRTPHQEIQRVRIGRVKELLLQTDCSLDEIAARTGFPHTEYLSVAFKRETGLTPRAFRKQAFA
jgi:LacI family transcriptional regulator